MSLIRETKCDMVDVQVYDTYENMGLAAADAVEKTLKDLLEKRDEISIILGVGPSQYTTFSALKEKTTIDWARVNLFQIDEVIGIEADDPQLLSNILEEKMTGGLPLRKRMFLNAAAGDLHAECRRYAALLDEYKPDVVLLGIGDNGHLALNEPGISPFNDVERVKVVRMDERTKCQPMEVGGSRAPIPGHEFGITITLPPLMAVPHKFCIAPFTDKADAVNRAMFGPVGEDCPASILRQTPGVTAFFDADSASLFPKA